MLEHLTGFLAQATEDDLDFTDSAVPMVAEETSRFGELFRFSMPLELEDPAALWSLLLSLPILVLASFGYAWMRKINLKNELTQRDNPASAISFAGYLAAIGIILAGISAVPRMPGLGIFGEILETFAWGAGAVILLLVALYVNDRVIFSRMDNRHEVLDNRNLGLAVAEAGTFISTALVMKTTLGEEFAPASLPEPLQTIAYFIFGQGMFLIYSRLYPKVAGIKLREDLSHQNPAVGIAFAGSLLAFAILMSNAMTFYGSFSVILFLSALYLGLLFLIRFACRIFLHRLIARELEDDANWGIGILEATVSLTIALILTSVL